MAVNISGTQVASSVATGPAFNLRSGQKQCDLPLVSHRGVDGQVALCRSVSEFLHDNVTILQRDCYALRNAPAQNAAYLHVRLLFSAFKHLRYLVDALAKREQHFPTAHVGMGSSWVVRTGRQI